MRKKYEKPSCVCMAAIVGHAILAGSGVTVTNPPHEKQPGETWGPSPAKANMFDEEEE